jgi:hypothetical protein
MSGKQDLSYTEANFWERFGPRVTWASIPLVLILSILHGWKTRQIDFVLLYPQADVEMDMYMNVPKGRTLKIENSNLVLTYTT